MHNDNKNKDIIILGEWATWGLNNTTLTAETEYSTDLSRSEKFLFKSS